MLDGLNLILLIRNMAQPVKDNIKPNKKKTSKRITKKNSDDKRIPPKRNVPVKGAWKKNIKHPEYGTSKLEERFAHDILDKLGVKYIYQYKAESIGRYFDFRIMPRGPIIEIQGSYWHGDPRLYEEKDLNSTQKRDIKIDGYKKAWCERNGIPLIYIWELDINKHPEKVISYLKNVLKPYINGIMDNKNKRH